MTRIVLGSGILRRDNAVLLVCCRYEGETEPLWTLPGGRQEPGEPIEETVRREFREETSLELEVGELVYVSESVDRKRDLHVLNLTFWALESDPNAQPVPQDPKIVRVGFVPVKEALALLRADVLRMPVTATLDGTLQRRYFFFDNANIAVPFFTIRSDHRNLLDG